jgi:hypothetical protein
MDGVGLAAEVDQNYANLADLAQVVQVLNN